MPPACPLTFSPFQTLKRTNRSVELGAVHLDGPAAKARALEACLFVKAACDRLKGLLPHQQWNAAVKIHTHKALHRKPSEIIAKRTFPQRTFLVDAADVVQLLFYARDNIRLLVLGVSKP